MTYASESPSRDRRGARVVWALVLTLVLAVALAWQAIDAARLQRATATGVLNDYATFAAEQYTGRVTRDLELYGVYPILQGMRAMPVRPGFSFPAPDDVRATAPRSLQQALDLVQSPFWLDLNTGEIELTASSRASTGNTGAIRDLILDHSRTVYDSTWSSAVLVADRLIYTVLDAKQNDTDGPYAVGFVADSAELERYFRSAFERAPLLPTTLTGAVSSDSVLAMTIDAASGETIFALSSLKGPRRYDSPSVAYPLGARFGDLVVHVALQPGMEEMLVIGGLPRSRVPLTVGLALLTAGLIVVTILKIQRERELARLRTEFVSNVSHELRTPLAQIRMFAETLMLGRVRSGEERNRALSIIDKEARRLTTLVENVLHFSRAERQAMRLAPETLDLAYLLEEVVESFRPLAAANRVTITTDLPSVTTRVDPGALRQIVLNLLDNALKYGPEGQTVHVSLERSESAVCVRVHDEGPGIPTRDRQRVWGRFTRLSRERESATAGAGIGLAVVRELTALHGGRSWVAESERGAAFVVELPLRVVGSSTERSRGRQAEGAAGR